MIAAAPVTDVQQIVKSDGQPLVVDDKESADIDATFTDSTGATIDPTNLATIELTIKRRITGDVVNSIEDVNVKDTGRGKINGNVLEIRLDGDDTGLAGDDDELHVMTLKGTFNDGVGVRTYVIKGQYWVRSAVLP